MSKYATQQISPVVVDYINNGVIEVWENTEALKVIKSGFVKYCQEQPTEAMIFVDEYIQGLTELKKLWEAETVYNSKSELKVFVDEVKRLVTGDLFMTYIGESNELIGEVKDICYKLRSDDHFFVSNNTLIKKSLMAIYPKLSDYINVIKFEEVDNPPSLAECQQRFVNFVCAADGYSQIEALTDYENNTNLVFKQEQADVVDEKIKGFIANKGRVSGAVKLVFSERDLDKVKDGDIIVSPMTTVDMMPAIKRCAAIVTDEGGIICHAAIVSRELNKPCVVATKAATKIFKDNDKVEVDGDSGVVRFINKNNQYDNHNLRQH